MTDPPLSALDLADILDHPEPTPPDVMHQMRLRLVALLAARGRAYSTLAREAGVSRSTAYEWAQQGAALWLATGDAPEDVADALTDLPPLTVPTTPRRPARRAGRSGSECLDRDELQDAPAGSTTRRTRAAPPRPATGTRGRANTAEGA
ncbi:hypothetical protein AB0N09_21745 [Streptomyces erythrochromogenes]|uniref:hypothetical protein n=1 Tax=Streptomyces erythrochromogenes TaxID=285574 RepID=UPI00344A17E6